MREQSPDQPCPCGSGEDDAKCCGPSLFGAIAPSATALMRSRYTAYVRGDEAYLLRTWHPETRPNALGLEQSPQPKWLGLEIKRHEVVDENHAVVEFVARYKVNGRAFRMHEISRFERVGGMWFYVAGEVRDDPRASPEPAVRSRKNP